jgi:hypothetical protein
MTLNDDGVPTTAIEDEMKEACRAIADHLKGFLPKGVCFATFLFSVGEHGFTAYISNAQRDDVSKALRDHLKRADAA